MADEPAGLADADDGGLTRRVIEFAAALRTKGITIGTGETVDAAAVIDVLGMEHRPMLREGLAAALLRRAGQRDTFDSLFDIYFPAAVGRPQIADSASTELTIDDLRQMLVEALAAGDADALDPIAQIAVDRFGQVDNVEDSWSAYRTLDRMNPQNLLTRALAQRGTGQQSGKAEGASGQGSGGTGGAGELGDGLERDDIRALIAAFRQRVEAEARRRTAEARGRDRMAKFAVSQQGERVDFLSANAAQLEALKRAVRPLARRLATRLAARRKRHNRGKIDMRKTLRRSLSTGGVPMELSFQKPHPSRPELVLLCDVSGSVAGFSNFTMLLVQAMKGQFSKLRVFAFVNAMAEVTDLVDADGDDLLRRIMAETAVTRWHGSSDYGAAFTQFVDEHIGAITQKSSVLILGDGRNNYQRPAYDALREIAARSRRTFWLNPERTGSWGQGDSAALEYSHIVEMHESRTVEQLSTFVTQLLPV
jgi:uncharacterized protein with von Willebrand factor type A (vWA) domain